MHTFSKTHIVLTVLAIIVIAYVVVTNKNKSPSRTVTPQTIPTTPTTTSLWQSYEVKRELISESNQYYTIEAYYPVTLDTRISGHFKDFVDEQIAQFKEDTSWVTDSAIDSASANVLSLDIQYREERSTYANTYVFNISMYTGGAHGLQVTRTFAFDKNGKSITFEDIFNNSTKGLTTVSTFVQKELVKKAISDEEWIAKGAAPNGENYQNFIINDTGVTFIFDPYQVAAYAAGPQNILVPLSVFKAFANPSVFAK